MAQHDPQQYYDCFVTELRNKNADLNRRATRAEGALLRRFETSKRKESLVNNTVYRIAVRERDEATQRAEKSEEEVARLRALLIPPRPSEERPAPHGEPPWMLEAAREIVKHQWPQIQERFAESSAELVAEIIARHAAPPPDAGQAREPLNKIDPNWSVDTELAKAGYVESREGQEPLIEHAFVEGWTQDKCYHNPPFDNACGLPRSAHRQEGK